MQRLAGAFVVDVCSDSTVACEACGVGTGRLDGDPDLKTAVECYRDPDAAFSVQRSTAPAP